MTLTAAWRAAQSSLFNVTQQTSLVLQNIGEASNPDYVSRHADVFYTDQGSRVYSIKRADQPVLFRDAIAALSDSSAQSVLESFASRLQSVVNGPDNANAPATRIDALRAAMQLYSSDPSSDFNGRTVVEAARDAANAINSASADIQQMRVDIDRQIAASADDLRGLLNEFEDANAQIVSGTALNHDVNDQLDRRDGLLKRISEYVSVSVVPGKNNDYALYTDQGVTLFETVPRAISFEPQGGYGPGDAGAVLRIDGVPVQAGVGNDTTASGSLPSLLQVRDEVTGKLQTQLDEIARGLIDVFQGGLPADEGLFISGLGALPTAGTTVPGLAQVLQVNPQFDPDQGGDPSRLRDNGAYVSNTSGAAGFAENLLGYIGALDTDRAFDGASGITGQQSLGQFAQASLGWIENLRSGASLASETKLALHEKLAGDYMMRTGVSIDEELAKLIALEQSYSASARVISTVDELFDTLLAIA